MSLSSLGYRDREKETFMKGILRAVVSVLKKRGRTAACSRLDWRGRPRGEDGPSARAPSGGTPLPSVTSIDDTLVPAAPNLKGSYPIS
jgi:hypothetical protein